MSLIRKPLKLSQSRSHDSFQHITQDIWLADALRVNPLVEKIHKRGGKVVFVRFPCADELYRYSQLIFPKEQYWNRFASQTSAETVHFNDYEQLSRFYVPDMSHLDYRDAPKYTLSLAEILVPKGVSEHPVTQKTGNHQTIAEQCELTPYIRECRCWEAQNKKMEYLELPDLLATAVRTKFDNDQWE